MKSIIFEFLLDCNHHKYDNCGVKEIHYLSEIKFMENNFQSTIPNIQNHLLLGVLTTLFCCLPLGIVSIIYAIQVNSAMALGNYSVAQVASEKAKYWGMLSLWIGIALNVIGFIFCFILGLVGVAI